MNKEQVLEAVKRARENSKKRKFNQSFDLIINLKNLNLKKPEENLNAFVVLKKKGKKCKIGALVGPELVNKAKEVCDTVISVEEFPKYATKIKKLAKKIDFFIAQADLMPKIAGSFGKTLGQMGKMPNPKAGCVVPKAIPSLKPVVDKLSNTVRLQTKNEQIVKSLVGVESMTDEEISSNIIQIYDYLSQNLPQDKNNISNAFLKLTMGKSVIIGEEIKKTIKKPAEKSEKKLLEKPKKDGKEN